MGPLYFRSVRKIAAAGAAKVAKVAEELREKLKQARAQLLLAETSLKRAEADLAAERDRRIELEGSVEHWRNKFRVARGLRPSPAWELGA